MTDEQKVYVAVRIILRLIEDKMRSNPQVAGKDRAFHSQVWKDARKFIQENS